MSPTEFVLADVLFFDTVLRKGSLTAAANELQISPAAASQRLAAIERRLRTQILTRSTRKLALTPAGELFLRRGREIWAQADALRQELVSSNAALVGAVRVSATLGFGRTVIAPMISAFVKQHPAVAVQLDLCVDPPSHASDTFDVSVRFGAPPDAHVHAVKLAANERIVCATPKYLREHGRPSVPGDLIRHQAIVIAQRNHGHGVWRFAKGSKSESVKVKSSLTTNDGAVAVQWALADHGLLLRARWDVQPLIDKGKLLHVLDDWKTPDANVYALIPTAQFELRRVRAFVEFLQARFAALQ
jgi:LysR family transcriptional regulator, transcriptional activator for dmlA